jgi:hypothetical protein
VALPGRTSAAAALGAVLAGGSDFDSTSLAIAAAAVGSVVATCSVGSGDTCEVPLCSLECSGPSYGGATGPCICVVDRGATLMDTSAHSLPAGERLGLTSGCEKLGWANGHQPVRGCGDPVQTVYCGDGGANCAGDGAGCGCVLPRRRLRKPIFRGQEMAWPRSSHDALNASSVRSTQSVCSRELTRQSPCMSVEAKRRSWCRKNVSGCMQIGVGSRELMPSQGVTDWASMGHPERLRFPYLPFAPARALSTQT